METKITTFSALADNINSRIHEGLRWLLFSCDDVEAVDLRSIGAVACLAEAAFLLVYLDWDKRGRGIDKNKLPPHARNAVDLLENVYAGERLCLDVIIYVLTEAKRDVMQNGKASIFSGILTNHDCHYGHIYDLIYYWTNDVDFCEKDMTVIFNAVLSILESVNWFDGVELLTGDDGMTFKIGERLLPCGDYLCKEANGYYLLESYELVENNPKRSTAVCKYAYFTNPRNKLELVKTKEMKYDTRAY